MTLSKGGFFSAWSYVDEAKNTSKCGLYACAAVALLFVGVQFSGAAVAQEVNVPAGPPPGDLQCPHPRHSALSRLRRHHQEEMLEPPSSEDLAALPVQGVGEVQEVGAGGPVRLDGGRPYAIGLWGDSHAAADYFSEELARAIGVPQGKVRPTFIPPTMDRSGVRLPIRKSCQSNGWEFEYAYVSRQTREAYAKGLVNLRTAIPNSYLWVDFRAQPLVANLRGLDVLLAPPAPGEKVVVGVTVDDGAEQVVQLEQEGQSEQEGRGIIRIHAEQAMSTVKLRLIEGALVLQGFVPKYIDQPALYLDTLGIPGATVRGWKALDAEYLKKRGSDTHYDLVILEYGTNEGNDRSFDPDRYAADLRAAVQNLRLAYPESPCVLIGPTDRGVLVKRARGKKNRHVRLAVPNLLKYSRIHQTIGGIQNAIAQEYSCAYWSWQDAMGGPGGAYRWLHHSPPLMARDLIHLTIPGYQLSARKFVADIRLPSYLH